MRIVIAFSALLGLAAVSLPAGAAVPGAVSDTNIVRVQDGCMPGWHVVPGHRLNYTGEWVPARCAPNNRGGDWYSPYPAYPEPPRYVYPVPRPWW
jgi:hypothetical protein